MIAIALLLGLLAPQDGAAGAPSTELPGLVVQAPPSPREGRVTLECTAQESGRLSNCRILEETPAGAGFGEAALSAARRSRVTPPRGRSGASARVRFTTRFSAPPAADGR